MRSATARLPRMALAAYAAPAMAFAILLLPPYVFLPAFYAQTLGLPLDWIGYILVFSRMFDAVTDPLVGRLSDRTPPRFGRRKAWMLLGMPIVLAAAAALFVPPQDVSLAYFAGGMFALTLGWTMMTIPYNALGAELSGDYHERTRIAGAREGVGLLGTLIAASAPVIVTLCGYPDPRAHMAALAIAIAALMIPSLFWCVARVSEPRPLSRRTTDWRTGLRALAANAPFRRLITAYLINAVANGLPATLFILFVSHVLGAGGDYGALLLAYFLAGLLAIPFWLRLAKAIGKHRAWVAAMLLACSAFAFVPVLGEGDVGAFFVICVVSGFALGADLVLPAAIQADVVDADTQTTGEERTGLLFALWGIATKLAFALAALSFPILALWGFEAGAIGTDGRTQNSVEALRGLAILYGSVPIAIKLSAAALMWNFPLDAARQRDIRRQIELPC